MQYPARRPVRRSRYPGERGCDLAPASGYSGSGSVFGPGRYSADTVTVREYPRDLRVSQYLIPGGPGNAGISARARAALHPIRRYPQMRKKERRERE